MTDVVLDPAEVVANLNDGGWQLGFNATPDLKKIVQGTIYVTNSSLEDDGSIKITLVDDNDGLDKVMHCLLPGKAVLINGNPGSLSIEGATLLRQGRSAPDGGGTYFARLVLDGLWFENGWLIREWYDRHDALRTARAIEAEYGSDATCGLHANRLLASA